MEKLDSLFLDELVNEKPLNVEIDHKRFLKLRKFFRLPLVKRFTVPQACIGCLMNMAARANKIDVTKFTTEEHAIAHILDSLNEDGDKMIASVAILLTNATGNPSKRLMRFIKRNATPTELRYMLSSLFKFQNLKDFLTSIILVQGMSLTKPEEIIAPESSI